MDAATDQAIGTTLPAIMAAVTIETGSSALSTTSFTRLNDQQLAAMEDLANLPLAAPTPCSAIDFAKLMRSLSILPSRADDEDTGKLRLGIYHRMMGHYPREAIAYMAEAVMAKYDWFPTPRQCLEILAEWRDRDAVEHKHRTTMAASAVRQERQARLSDIMDALDRRSLDQAAIDALPSRVREIGAERGFLRLHDDGVYRARPVPVPTDG